MVDEPAKQRGLRILSIDRPGMGCSPPANHPGWEPWPDMLAAFLDSLGITRFSQLAVSGGGPYAIAAAAILADRVNATAVLCGAVPINRHSLARMNPLYRALASLRHLPGWVFAPAVSITSRILTRGPRDFPVRQAIQLLPAADARLTAECPELVSTLMAACREGLKQGARAVLDNGSAYLGDWKADLSKIRNPVHFWHGGMDRTIPLPVAEDFIQLIPGSVLHVLPEEGHFSLAIHQCEAALDLLAGKNS